MTPDPHPEPDPWPVAGGPAVELVEVVDEAGGVIDVVTRAEVRDRRLRHRCTYVAVVTTAGELVVHRRAEWKDVYPGYWDVCFGGVASVGEAWDVSARRELEEEAGLDAGDLVDLGPVSYDDDDGRIFGRVYLVWSDTEPTCPDGEVVEVGRVPLAAIDAWLLGRRVCADSTRVALPLVRAHVAAEPSTPNPDG